MKIHYSKWYTFSWWVSECKKNDRPYDWLLNLLPVKNETFRGKKYPTNATSMNVNLIVNLAWGLVRLDT